jgi:hypothetical protein
MNLALRSAYHAELAAAAASATAGEIEVAFHHLARAHILSQRHTWQHVHVHSLMFSLGLRGRNWREAAGQISRMIAAAMFSRIWVPAGNTGRANVSALRRMPIPDDLRAILDGGGVSPR